MPLEMTKTQAAFQEMVRSRPDALKSTVSRLETELAHALVGLQPNELAHLVGFTVKTFGRSAFRRSMNVVKLVGAVGIGTWNTAKGIYEANQDPDPSQVYVHVGDLVGVTAAKVVNGVNSAKTFVTQLTTAICDNPREELPKFLTMVVVSLVVSGGPDGDGGAPDLDLLVDIGAHRSWLSHSILMGAALESGLVTLLEVVSMVHARLPQNHLPLWDKLHSQAAQLTDAANKGVSFGMAYHLVVDGLVQAAPYHGLGVPLPMEAHQAGFVANAAAEAMDGANKPRAVPGARPVSGTSDSATASSKAAAPKKPWWTDAPPQELAEMKFLHEALLAEHFEPSSYLMPGMTRSDEQLLRSHGSWLYGLTDGLIRPLNSQEMLILRVSFGLCEPQNELERVWHRYLCACVVLNTVYWRNKRLEGLPLPSLFKNALVSSFLR